MDTVHGRLLGTWNCAAARIDSEFNAVNIKVNRHQVSLRVLGGLLEVVYPICSDFDE